ncbi:MAG: spore coat U domain-containing protein [Polaromonas sp.]|nr:spore coat U domain-containing protein [Polaromonas sp.]
MKHKLCLAVVLLAAATSAQAAITCNLSATGVTGNYTAAANTRLTGSLTVNCARLASDSGATVTYYISMDQGEPPAGRNMTRQGGTQLLAYTVFRNSSFTGSWTTGGGRAPNNTGNGGLDFTINWNGALNSSATVPYYFEVAAGITRPAGIYDDVPTFSIFTTRGGTLLGAASYVANISIVAECFFNSAIPAVTVNYPSFSATARTGSSSYSLSCTLSTPYTMAVTPTAGTLMGLNYTVAPSAASGTGSAFPQTYSVTATVPADQSGTCAVGACAATQAHQITITY